MGAEHVTNDREKDAVVTTDRLALVFVEVADTLVADFDLIDFLHSLTKHAADLSDAPAVGLMLADQHDRLHHMAASSESAQLLELFQLQHSEGPCLDAYDSGEAVVVDDLSGAAVRWPVFAPRAVAAGVSSVHAFPMRLRDKVIGALNVFGVAPLDETNAHLVQALADIATISIIQERAIAHAGLLTEQLQGALNSRIVIEQAKGMVARERGIDVEAAFDLLRSHARSNHMRLGDLAHAIVTGSADVPSRPSNPTRTGD